jgi:hypothetical protein
MLQALAQSHAQFFQEQLAGRVSVSSCGFVDNSFAFVYLFHRSFTLIQQVKSVEFTQFNNGVDPELNATTIHTVVNRECLGFEDINDADPTQTLTITTRLREGSDSIMLMFVKFHRLESITFFIEENQEGEVSALGSLNSRGQLSQRLIMNMSKFKKNPY